MTRWLMTLPLFTYFLIAQNPVSGNATISFVEAGSLCDGALKRIEVYVDITGLIGQGGDAGLNAFSLFVTLDDPSFYVRSESGTDPFSFDLTTTAPGRISTVGSLRLVGHKADTLAPNQAYHVASIFLGNQIGSVTLSLDIANSSLGSRRVGGAGPGPIGMSFDGPLTVTIDTTSSIQISDAFPAWLTTSPGFDLQPPFGIVDILDLVAIAECSAP